MKKYFSIFLVTIALLALTFTGCEDRSLAIDAEVPVMQRPVEDLTCSDAHFEITWRNPDGYHADVVTQGDDEADRLPTISRDWAEWKSGDTGYIIWDGEPQYPATQSVDDRTYYISVTPESSSHGGITVVINGVSKSWSNGNATSKLYTVTNACSINSTVSDWISTKITWTSPSTSSSRWVRVSPSFHVNSGHALVPSYSAGRQGFLAQCVTSY
jgi:hypothetical protein